jgi:hypothetical protein
MTGYVLLGGGLVLAVLGLVFVAIARSKVRRARTIRRHRSPQFERPILLEGHPFADGRPEVSGHPDSPSRPRPDDPETMTTDAESDDSIPPL